MTTSGEPSADNNYLGEHVELLESSLLRMTGRRLVDPELWGRARYQSLFEAPFCVVSHGTEEDPVFNYGNRTALQLFEMTWDDFTNLPSRRSAEPLVREEREELLARVTQHGFIDDYKGVRVSSSGQRFFVDDAVVWNLADESGAYRGQAAALFKWTKL